MRFVATLLSLTSLAWLLNGCELEGSKIERIVVLPASSLLTVADIRNGDEVQQHAISSKSCIGEALAAYAIFSDNSISDITRSVRWNSSKPEQLVVGNCFSGDTSDDCTEGAFDDRGRITPTSSTVMGPVKITATFLDTTDTPISDDIDITFNQTIIESLKITPATATLSRDNPTVFMNLNAYFSDGTTQDLTSFAEWQFAAPSSTFESESKVLWIGGHGDNTNAAEAGVPTNLQTGAITLSNDALSTVDDENDSVSISAFDKNVNVTATLCTNERVVYTVDDDQIISASTNVSGTAEIANSNITANVAPATLAKSEAGTLNVELTYSNSELTLDNSASNWQAFKSDGNPYAESETAPASVVSNTLVVASTTTSGEVTFKTSQTFQNQPALVPEDTLNIETNLVTVTDETPVAGASGITLIAPDGSEIGADDNLALLAGLANSVIVKLNLENGGSPTRSINDASYPLSMFTSSAPATDDTDARLCAPGENDSIIVSGGSIAVTRDTDNAQKCVITFSSTATITSESNNQQVTTAASSRSLNVIAYQPNNFELLSNSFAIREIRNGKVPRFAATITVRDTVNETEFAIDVSTLVSWTTTQNSDNEVLSFAAGSDGVGISSKSGTATILARLRPITLTVTDENDDNIVLPFNDSAESVSKPLDYTSNID